MNKRLLIVPKRLFLVVLSFCGLVRLSAQTCNVTSAADGNGAGTFAACLEGNFNVINFDAGLAGQTITFAAVEVNKPVTINGRADITLDGSGAYQKNPWNTNMITVISGDVVFNDLVITNATGPAAWDGTGILVADGLSNITLNNVEITNSKNAGFATSTWVCGTCGNSLGTSDITVTGGNYSNNGTSGFVVSHSDNFNVDGATFDNNTEHGLYMNGDTYVGGAYIPTTDLTNAVGVTNGTIENVTSTNNGNGGITVAGNSTGNTIDNCNTNNNNEHGLWLRLASSNNTIQNCTSNDNGGGSLACGINISLGGNLNNNILNNSCSGNQDYGIYLYDNYGIPNDNNLISGNTVTTSGSHGIYVLNSTNTLVRGNEVHSNGTGVNGGDGVNFGNSSSGGEVSGNDVYSNASNGINITEGVLIPADPADNNTVAIPAGGSNDNAIFDNYVGIRPGTGVIAGNTLNGVTIFRSSGNQVGAAGRNYVSGNQNHGIYLDEIPVGTQSVIRDNFIGTDLTGNGATGTGNTLSGIFLSSCKQVLIDDNLISGNGQDGIQLGNAAANVAADVVEIENNKIGTDLAGTAALPNGRHGINVDNANFVEIGDGTAAGRNIISGNGEDGIQVTNNASNVIIDENYIGLDATGVAILGNTDNGIDMTGANTNTIQNSYVSGNGNHGIFVQSATSSANTISNNFVGMMTDGTDAGNTGDGIRLDQCVDNTLEANNVGWNDGDGISLHGTGTNGNDLISNYIGIDNVNNIRPNDGNGIYIASVATDNQIGNVGTGNFISGNLQNGIMIDGSSGNGIDGNTIGLNTTRTGVIPNGAAFSGIHITGAGATNNVIGDLARNYIAGPHTQQILIDNGANGNEVKNVTLGDQTLAAAAQSTGNAILITGTGTDNNVVGGVIGTDENFIYHSNNVAVLINAQASSNTVKSNIFESVGASSPISAIQVNNGNDNIIGGGAADQGNVISTTSSNAIVVDGTSDGNQIQFNYIGVDQNEASVGPIEGHGILLDGAGVSNTIINENVIGNVDDAANAAVFINGVSAISTLYGNYVGITRNDLAIANTGHGIWVTNSSDAVSVGTVGQNPNVISNNALNGVEVDNSTTTTVVNNFIGTDVAGAVSVGNGQNGVHFGAGNTGVGVYGNIIQGNTQDGILVDNEIGGTTIIGDGGTLGGGNRLLDNGGHGVNVTTGTNTDLTISSNGIGVVAGNASTSGNTANGVNITNFSGTALIENNIIGGNNYGIELNAATGVTIDGNFVGLSNNNPSENLANTLDGIYVHTNSDNNTINGNALGFSNQNAIEIDGVAGTTISGNRIGVADLTTLQDAGNTLNGIAYVNGASGGTITGNVIGFNDSFGIMLDGATGVTIDGNFIGADTQNSTNDLRNDVDGISLLNGANGNTISSNTIAHHNSTGATGLRIDGAASIQNTITQNNMYCNEADQSASATPSLEGNGINLENDGNDLYPNKITGVVFSTVQPVLDGTRLYMEGENLPVGAVVEIFQSDDNCVNCQGKTYISQTTVDASGEWSATVTAAQTYVVTLRDPGTNNTSEFSACSTTPPCTPPVAQAGDDGSTCENTLFDLSTRTIVADSTGSGQNGTILWEAFDGWADGSPVLTGGTFSSTTILNPTYTPPTGFEGVVKLRITVSNNPCTPALDSIQLTVEPQPVANAGDDASICEGTALDLSGRTTVADSTGSGNAGTITWTDGGAGGAFNDASLLNPIYTPVATTGTVTLTMTVDGNNSCTDATDDMVITINPEPTAATVTTNSETCSDTPITLAVGDVTATNYDAISWVVTTGNGTITAGGTTLTPTYTPSTGTPDVATVTLTMTATAITPCATDATTPIDIAITPAPTADAGNDQATCVDVAYTLDGSAATTNSPSMSWAVTTGNGTITAGATTLTPTYTPATADAGTTVVLTLTADGNNSCNAQTSTMNLTVNALPTPTVTGNQAPCPNAQEDYGISGVTATPFTSTWTNSIDPSIGTDNADNTYSMNYGPTGSGNITATVTDNNGCISSVDYAVNVLDNPTVTVATSAVCTSEQQIFTATASPTASYTYTFRLGDPGNNGTVLQSGTSNTYGLTDGDQVNFSTLHVEVVPTNCPTSSATSSAVAIEFYDLPTASITGPTVICSSESATLVAGATGVSSPSYAWTSPNGNNGSASSYTGDAGEGGTYSLVVTNADDATGVCQASTTYDVSVVTVDVSAIASEYDVDEGTDVTISATPDTYSSYSWVTSDGDDKGTATSFTETMTETTTYIVTASEGNCDDVAEVTVNVRALVVVPSMFTPGNGDGRNDYWILTNIEDYPEAVIKVYNRWGNIVYEGPGGDTYFNDPWDGTRGGVEVPTAVYYYVIDLKYKDIILAGDVTIMR